MLLSNQIRESFINYFKGKGHKHVLSSPLIPHDDPTILFTNAGMNQFKDYFLGETKVDFTKAVTCQKVMRAGGKHNDLENVGYTARHQTFFEMLGNFSFGDYFKQQAIYYAWEFLTDILKIDKDRLAVSIFHEDEEAFKIWKEQIGLPEDRIAKLGEKDNFWSMGDTGPCGPCSEIHYKLTAGQISKTYAQSLLEDDGSFLEIWNLVFMQYDKQVSGKLVLLPNPSIDTGCGLERLASVMQDVKSNFDTDIFKELINNISKKANYRYLSDANKDVSVRVIADHMRATTFAIADGALPSNEGRGYVIRRIIRRALRHAGILGIGDGGLTSLVEDFLPSCFLVYPEVKHSKQTILDCVLKEEQRFKNSLKKGMAVLDEVIAQAKKAAKTKVSGKEVFKLYDTYGFPVDITEEILNNEKLFFDNAEFLACMEEQKLKARTSNKDKTGNLPESKYRSLKVKLKQQEFVGYEVTENVTAASDIFQNGKSVETIDPKYGFELLLKNTPFYATAGGQVGDVGVLENESLKFSVFKTSKIYNGFHLCHCKLVNSLIDKISLSDLNNIKARVDAKKRLSTSINHTAAHLLHAALRSLLGSGVRQAGSYVDYERIRFDFTYNQALDLATLSELEAWVFYQIKSNHEVLTELMPLKDALKKGALAFFADKYGDEVRVVKAGPKSIELCGGTHAQATSQIGFFKIINETSVASGIRRIEALTDEKAFNHVSENLIKLAKLSKFLVASEDNVLEKFENLLLQKQNLEKQHEDSQIKIAELKLSQLLNAGKQANKNLLWVDLGRLDKIKLYAKIAKTKFKDGIIVLWQKTTDNKGTLALVVGESKIGKINAGALIKDISHLIEGKGGGSQSFAQASGYLKNKAELLESISKHANL